MGADSAADVFAGVELMRQMRQQLTSISADIEGSVTGVTAGFHGMAHRARSAVERAATSFDNPTGDTPIDLVRSAMEEMLVNVRTSANFSFAISKQILAVEGKLTAIEQCLNNVEKVADQAKLVALNGQIEANRLGDAGVAFGVVAQETKTLAGNAGNTSESIREMVADLGAALRETSAGLQNQNEQDSKIIAESEQTVSELLDSLAASHNHMSESLSEMSSISAQLGQDIGQAVMSLQFQDRVSQRIAHVCEALEFVSANLEPASEIASPRAKQKRLEDWSQHVQSSYTMESERTGQTQDVMFDLETENADNCVELF
ncbi:MAG: methyl-accepting chemotaxis protein [Pirellulaceae bacterium]